jgi:ABC-2 type transport system permease protein
VRQLRSRDALIFRIVLPAALFVLFRVAFVEDKPTGSLPPDADAMVVFAVLGVLFSGVFASGPPLAKERAVGWLRQLRVMPLPDGAVVAGKLAAALTFALPSIVLVFLSAAATQGVRLGAGQWLELIALVWIAAVPFAVLGVLIGVAIADPDTAQSAASASLVALWVLGGMVTEPSDLPGVLETLARILPTNGAAELGWAAVRGEMLPLSAMAVLIAWTVGLGGLAALAWRRLGEAR